MTNFRKTLLAVGIGLALGFSAEVGANADSAKDGGAKQVPAVPVEKSEAEAKFGSAAANNGGKAVDGEADADYKSAAANNHSISKVDNSETEAKFGSAAANNKSYAYADNSENSKASAKGGDALSAINGGEIDKSSASAFGGDALSAQNGSKIDQSVENDHSDHSVANRDGEVEFKNFEANQDAELKYLTVNIGTSHSFPANLNSVNGALLPELSNKIKDSINGSAGVIAVGQNLGGVASIQQSVNVLGEVTVANVGIAP